MSPNFFFPEDFSSLDINNVIFFDDKNNQAQIEGTLEIMNKNIKIYHNVLDSIKKSYYKNLGYDEKTFRWLVKNYEITKRMIIVHPNETLFYEVPISLPFNYNSVAAIRNRININKNKKYKLQLILNSKIDSIENFLTESQLLTFKANNYKIYSGFLTSSNTTDVTFK